MWAHLIEEPHAVGVVPGGVREVVDALGPETVEAVHAQFANVFADDAGQCNGELPFFAFFQEADFAEVGQVGECIAAGVGVLQKPPGYWIIFPSRVDESDKLLTDCVLLPDPTPIK